MTISPAGLHIFPENSNIYNALFNPKKRAEDFHLVQVSQRQYLIPISTLRARAPMFLKYIEQTSGNPVILPERPVGSIDAFLLILLSEPLPPPSELPIPNIINIAELTYTYSCGYLWGWVLAALRWLVTRSKEINFQLLSSSAFSQLLRLAVNYEQSDLTDTIQSRWAARLFRNELPPAHAISLAYGQDLSVLLGPAFYAQMLQCFGEIKSGSKFFCRPTPPLLPQHKLHMVSGFYSLSTYWARLQRNSPVFEQSEDCHSHTSCVSVFQNRWVAAMSRSMPHPSVDVIRRLSLVQVIMAKDTIIKARMNINCRERALHAVLQLCRETWQNLHHHFDV